MPRYRVHTEWNCWQFCNRKTICVNLGGIKKKEPVSRVGGRRGEAMPGAPCPKRGAPRWCPEAGEEVGLRAKSAQAHHGARQHPSAPQPSCISISIRPCKVSIHPAHPGAKQLHATVSGADSCHKRVQIQR